MEKAEEEKGEAGQEGEGGGGEEGDEREEEEEDVLQTPVEQLERLSCSRTGQRPPGQGRGRRGGAGRG